MTDEEIISFCRWWLGNLSEDELSETDMDNLMDMVNSQYPDGSDCVLKYQLILAILRFLIREDSKESAIGGTSGDVTSRKEKRGDTEISVVWSTSDGEDASWSTILEDLIDDPTSIGCNPIEERSSPVNIGGSRVNQSKKVSSNPNSNSAYKKPRVLRKFGSGYPTYRRR